MPAGNTQGKITEREYDSVGRLVKDEIVNYGGAYMRYEYPTDGVQSKVYTTITDTNANGADAADEVLTESWADGAGRVRRSRTEHPGSTGGFSGTFVDYDILGRVTRQSVPTEVDSSWAAAGDDYTRGFLWTYQKYDWMGRVVRKIATDGVDSGALNDSDVLIDYEGCGCAGGQITTVQGELVPRDDQPTVNARRVQKVYADILGRAYKTVAMNWDGTTPYTTTVQTFNGRDQVTKTRQYAGTDTSTTYQDVLMTYDGHGRLKTRHYPIEDAQTETTWNYNADDSVSQVIDPRGAINDMIYDARGLTTQLAYTPPTGTTVPDTPTTVFTYDNLGNRTSMDTAGVSATAYSYDELSRLTAETVDFDDLTSNYSIGYGYEISGKLKTVTDPFGDSVSYNNDKMGRTNSITGSSFGGVTTYAENIKFRAFGGLKEMEYGSDDSSVMSYTFDDRLRLSGYESTSTVRTSGYVRRATYEYYADGHTKAVNNQENTSFGQEYKFDNAGRISQTTSGTVTSTVHGQVALYDQTIDYSAFGDITSRETSLWGEENDFSASYANGRKTGGTETFDALGNIVQNTPVLTFEHTRIETWAFDASGSLSEHVSSTHKSGGPNFHITHRLERSSDGDGRMVKRVETRRVEQQIPPGESETVETTYNIRSSVLGGVVTELYGNGGKISTKVHSGSAVLAEQLVAEVGQTESVIWRHTDVVTGSFDTVEKDGTFYKPDEAEYRAEFEPLGTGLPEDDPYIAPGTEPMPQRYRTGGGWNAAEPERGCFWNGAPIPCNHAGFILRTEGVIRVEVNERSPGGFRLLATLENVFKIRKTVTRNDITIG